MSDRDRKPPFQRGGGKGPDKRRESGRRTPWRDRDSSSDGPAILYGWHTVAAALANPERRIRKLWLSENAARRLADDHIDTRVAPEIVRPSLIDQRLGPDAVHQGLLAEADPLPSPGLDSQGVEDLGAVKLRQPLALVLGAEGKGLRQLTRETCSVVARLDMPGEIKSLNVSNAAVLALYIGASRLGLMG